MNSVVWRILVFYLGGIGTIVLLAPWNEQESNVSPFIRVLTGVGFGPAAAALNVVIVVAVFSVLNTMTYSGARMLRDLARNAKHRGPSPQPARRGCPRGRCCSTQRLWASWSS